MIPIVTSIILCLKNLEKHVFSKSEIQSIHAQIIAFRREVAQGLVVEVREQKAREFLSQLSMFCDDSGSWKPRHLSLAEMRELRELHQRYLVSIHQRALDYLSHRNS